MFVDSSRLSYRSSSRSESTCRIVIVVVVLVDRHRLLRKEAWEARSVYAVEAVFVHPFIDPWD